MLVPNHNSSPNNQITPFEDTLGDGEKEKLPFNRKEPLVEPGSHCRDE